MAFQNNTLHSGKEYNLSDLFSQNKKIIIPDLQRDYCWGDMAWDKDAEKYTELVSSFLKNISDIYHESPDRQLTLGLIYGYESPHMHIQLCDGQQRITTLFLILGIINRKTKNYFQSFLISEEELSDDNEPYLQYAIRESTLYFLSDLVCKYFLKSESEISFSDIKNSSWYFSEYNLDASIRSMLSAIGTIEKEFTKLSDFDYKSFGDFILTKLQMLYYDMENRVRGEETFVVINTTGEPLSATENLKPIIIGNIKNEEERKKRSDEWEEREEWFWQNRKESELMADDGVNQFFIWYWQIRLLQENTWKNKKSYPLNPRELYIKKPLMDLENDENTEIERWEKSINPETIHNYFKALEKLVNLSKDENITKVLHSIKDNSITLGWFRNSDLDVVLPLISYLEKFPQPQFFCEFVRRIRKNYFDRIRKRGSALDWRHLIQIIELSNDEKDVLTFSTELNQNQFKKIPNINLNEWFTQEEQDKNRLKQDYKSEIENWEDHIDLMGNLSPIWEANKEREKSYENLVVTYNNFESFYDCYVEKKSINKANLSNYFRLYRLFADKERLGKPYNTAGMKGAWFSWISSSDIEYFEYLKDPYFLFLLKIDDNLKIINNIKTKIKELHSNNKLTEENFTAVEHLKLWMLVKVIKAEKENVLLSFWDGKGSEQNDGNGFASYNDFEKNKINKNLPLTIGNSICGYAVKKVSRIDYATKFWGHQNCFDTIIGSYISLQEFQKRETDPISAETIKKIDIEIENLLADFYN